MTGMRTQFGGCRIDRSDRVAFTFDGKQYFGHPGDSLASALVANRVSVVGRSFKYHRPRGLMAAGLDEPNALVTITTDTVREPNIRATEVELHEGLKAESQNRWPSLAFDVSSINQLGGKALSAGFYYKTFMGPVAGPLKGTRFWMQCEKLIRRAAGLGRADTKPDPSHYERVNAFCDVLVVGAGRTGIEQARLAANSAKHVILIDSNPPIEDDHERNALRQMDNVRILERTTVWGHYDHGVYAATERVTDHMRKPAPALARHRLWVIRADHLSLCTGALERPIVFPGNDRPGVMLASAAHRYINDYAAAPGKSAIIFTNNDSAYAVVPVLAEAGISITRIVDVRCEISDAARTLAAKAGVPISTSHAVIATKGTRRINSVSIAKLDPATGAFTGSAEACNCDTLLVSGGWSPVIHLAAQKGDKPVWDEALQAFLPPDSGGNWSAHGAAAGRFDFGIGLSPYPAPFHEVDLPGKAFVDVQHDVTADDIRLAHREGFHSVEHLKRYTTLGMATDQGKTSNIPGLAILARLRGVTIPQAGTTRFRAPFTGISMGSIAAERYGDLYPHRLSPMHELHVASGANMVAAGRWMRPESYNKPGETVEQAYIREAKAVRTAVGMVDVSTLGKIDIQGPDAAEFLNRIYTNGFAKLAVGKARYGLMLREDGFAFDDGTTWRLSETRYLMTTTTANAGPVMQHMEKMLSVHWPALRVHLTSVTDQWAAIALAGPRSRSVLEAVVTGTAVDNETLPFMGIVHGEIRSIPVMICRLSFSGERAYEIYCGAHHGARLWDGLAAAGKSHGLVPYGLEALGALRIEKGHVTGAEIDGRTTASDLHLDWMVSSKKPFVGSALMNREGLTDPDRQTLVGVISRSGEKLKGGSHLVGSAQKDQPGRSLGHITAMAYSPEKKTYIGLALLEGGPNLIGTTLYATDPVRTGTHIPVQVVSHHMVDPEGVRMHD